MQYSIKNNQLYLMAKHSRRKPIFKGYKVIRFFQLRIQYLANLEFPGLVEAVQLTIIMMQ